MRRLPVATAEKSNSVRESSTNGMARSMADLDSGTRIDHLDTERVLIAPGFMPSSVHYWDDVEGKVMISADKVGTGTVVFLLPVLTFPCFVRAEPIECGPSGDTCREVVGPPKVVYILQSILG